MSRISLNWGCSHNNEHDALPGSIGRLIAHFSKRGRSRVANHRRRFIRRLMAEQLESRMLLAVYEVRIPTPNTMSACQAMVTSYTFESALRQANNHPNTDNPSGLPDRIVFPSQYWGAGEQRVSRGRFLVTDAVEIDGWDPAIPHTEFENPRFVIEDYGARHPDDSTCFPVRSPGNGGVLTFGSDGFLGGKNASGSLVRGLAIRDSSEGPDNGFVGVALYQENIRVQGNVIGPDASGTSTSITPQALDTLHIGIHIAKSATGIGPPANNTIGGSSRAERNVISGIVSNADPTLYRDGIGILVEASYGNQIWGNYIGTDVIGSVALPNNHGVVFYNAPLNFVGGAIPELRNIISGNVHNGVLITGIQSQRNQVIGNYIGTDPSGTTAVLRDTEEESNDVGVRISQGAKYNFVGGLVDESHNFIPRNIISGNGTGVRIESDGTTNNQVLGNYIGTDASGTARLADDMSNRVGVAIIGSSNNFVGLAVDGARNVISGNIDYGVAIQGQMTTGNFVLGNYIGTDETGTARLKDSTGKKIISNTWGVGILDGAQNNQIGATDAKARNVISGNLAAGVLIQGNFISETSENRVLGNYIGTNWEGNRRLEIDDTDSERERSNGNIGVVILGGAKKNSIGGTMNGARNVISGNLRDGVSIAGEGTMENRVWGNYIGPDATGLTAFLDGMSNINGVVLIAGASKNAIGGTDADDGIMDEVVNARNLISGNFRSITDPQGTVVHTGAGVFIAGAKENHVLGNYIGTDREGEAQLISNRSNNDGVVIALDSNDNIIGGMRDDFGNVIVSGNVISGNLSIGIRISASASNMVVGNYIGTTKHGTARLANENFGIIIGNGASFNIIGGPLDSMRNVISGNDTGVQIDGTETTYNLIQNNYIGTNAGGIAQLLGNTSNRVGVAIVHGANNNTIGGTLGDATRNVISGNLTAGVLIEGDGADDTVTTSNNIIGNYIGTDPSGTEGLQLGRSNTFGVYISQGAKLNIVGGFTNEARNIISGNLVSGVTIEGTGTDFNQILGNYIGTKKDGTSGLFGIGNGVGVAIQEGAKFNYIGRGLPETRNVISSNAGNGVQIIRADENYVIGNYIGTDKDGTRRISNVGNGVFINSNQNLIFGNVISGNQELGVRVFASFGNRILKNLIGTDKDGVPSTPPPRFFGLNNDTGGIGLISASGTVIGGLNADGSEEGNKILGNFGHGLLLFNSVDTRVQGNEISFNKGNGISIGNSSVVRIGPVPSTGDTLLGNLITDNDLNGVNVEGSRNVSLNSSLVARNGAAGLRCRASFNVTHSLTAFPGNSALQPVDCESVESTPHVRPTAIQRGSTIVEAVLTGSPNTSHRVEFFSGPPPDPAGFSDPAELIGSINVTTDASGIANIRTTFPANVPLGRGVMATATGPTGNTSEFSHALPVTEALPQDQLSVEDAAYVEGDSGALNMLEVEVIRRNVSDQTVTVEVATADGTATVTGGDYFGVGPLVLTFPPGVIRRTFQIAVRGDTFAEPDETVLVTLTKPGGGAVIGRATGTATILNDDSNALSIGDAMVTEGDDGTTTLDFPVRLANPTSQPVTVELNTADGTATLADGDYASLSGLVVTFNPGEPLEKTVSVTIHGDTQVESDETLTVTLSNATGPMITIADALGVGTIRNDDTIAISISDVSVAEGHTGLTPLEFVVSLSDPSDTPVSVRVDTANGSARAGEDYVAVIGHVVTFHPGDPLSQIVTVHALGDTTAEWDEFFFVRLSNPAGNGVSIADDTGQGTLVSDEPTEISIGDFARLEGTGGPTAFNFMVSLSNPVVVPLTVEVHTADGTATVADNDYSPVAGLVLTFNPGEPLSQDVTVLVTADATMEETETIFVRLSNATGLNVSIADDQAVGTIRNVFGDDTALFFIDDVTLAEGDVGSRAFVFTVRMTNPADRPLSVRVDTFDMTAMVAAGDYTPISNLVLTYNPGDPLTQSVVVPVHGNLLTEPDKTFRVALNNLPGDTVIIFDPSAIGTIRNDDGDSDGDGVSDKLEALGPNGGDMNRDGAPDQQQPHVAALPNSVDGRYVALVSSAGTRLAGVRAVDNPDPSHSPPSSTLAIGFFEFTVIVPAAGNAATVTMHLPSRVAPATFYEFGRLSPTDLVPSFSEFLYDGTTGAVLFSDRVVVHLRDGGRGDHDFADGRIGQIAAPVVGTDLALQMTGAPDTVGQNQPLRYTLTVVNNGPNSATGVTLVDTLPGGATLLAAESSQGSFTVTGGVVTFQLGGLPVGATATIVLDVLAPPDAGIATNSATVMATEFDRNLLDNTIAVQTLVKLIALIRGQKFHDRNGNGARDPGEIGLNGVTIELVDEGTGQVVQSTTTRPIDTSGDGRIDPETERGRYEFAVLAGGTFEVREQVPPGFMQTFPTGGGTGIRFTERVSVDGSGAQGSGTASRPTISADGHFVAFESAANNLVPGDTNNFPDIFVFDRQTRIVERVSVPNPGVGQAQANAPSRKAVISSNGRFVAFESAASNLVLGDNNPFNDVFVHDRVLGTTRRMSEDANGVGGNSPSGDEELPVGRPAISADGRFVAFISLATNLVPTTVFEQHRVYVKDRLTGAIERVSVTSAGSQVNGADAGDPAISADGRFVAFFSTAALTPDDTNGRTDIFVHDRQTRTVQRVSVPDASVAQVQANGHSARPALSADGRIVAFESSATNLVLGDTNAISDIFVRDRQTGTTVRVSVDGTGNQAVGGTGSTGASTSSDGRFVAFVSAATNLAPGDTNGTADVFVYDRQTGAIERVSVDSAGNQTVGNSASPLGFITMLSADGRTVAFDSRATNLVADDTNGVTDVFVRAFAPGGGGSYRVTVFPGEAVTGRDFGNAGDTVLDFGDAPDTYGTFVASNGARHTAVGPFLGSLVATEIDGQPNSTATGDDADGIDDEDGVTFNSQLVAGKMASIVVTASAELRLDAWIDFDADGQFGSAEQLFTSRMLTAGDSELQFPVPAAARIGRTYARFRASTSGGLLPTGQAADGEVEDYAVPIQPPPQADLVITKIANVQAAIAGTQFSYIVTVQNHGPSDAADVVVTDLLPAGVTLVATSGCANDPAGVPACTLGMIAAGSFKQYSIMVHVSSAVTGTLINEASVRSSTPEANPGDEQVQLETPIFAQADLSITKSANAARVAPGQRLTYSIVVTNRGPSDAREVIVHDVMPPGLTLVATSGCSDNPAGMPTCTLGALAAGASATWTITASVNAAFTGTLTNTATVQSLTPEGHPGDEESRVDVRVVQPADLAISIRDDGDPVVAGSNLFFTTTTDGGQLIAVPMGPTIRDSVVIYTVTVRNDGLSDATDVVVTHALPLGLIPLITNDCLSDPLDTSACSLGTIPAGGSRQYLLIGQVDFDVLGTITVNVAAATTTPETDLADNRAAEVTLVIQHADLAIEMLDDPDPVAAGGLLTYIIKVTNRGPSDAHGVVISDLLPPGVTLVQSSGCTQVPSGAPTCTLGTLRANRSKQVSLTVRVNSNVTGTITNRANVTSSTAEANPGDESASQTTKVTVPVGTPGKITGGGGIHKGIRNFGFNVQTKLKSGVMTFTGQLEFQDKSQNYKLHSKTITLIHVDADGVHGLFQGTATVNNKAGYRFTVDVEDNGEPGALVDRFRIQIAGPNGFYYDSNTFATGGGRLDRGGNIQIHKTIRNRLMASSTAGPEASSRRAQAFFSSTSDLWQVAPLYYRSMAQVRRTEGLVVDREWAFAADRVGLSTLVPSGKLDRCAVDQAVVDLLSEASRVEREPTTTWRVDAILAESLPHILGGLA